MKPRRALYITLSRLLLSVVGAALALSLLACMTPQRHRASGQPQAGRAEPAPVALERAPARHPEEEACDAGDAEACMRVGLDAIGQAQPQAHVAGVMALYRACELGQARGCLVYGLALWSEHGVAYSPQEARWAIEGADEREALAAITRAPASQTTSRDEGVIALARQACGLGMTRACALADLSAQAR